MPLPSPRRTKKDEGHKGPAVTNSVSQTLRGIRKMLVRYPVWDVSYDVATIFTIGKWHSARASPLPQPEMLDAGISHNLTGSVVWVINGFFTWLPLASPSSEFSGESTWGAGITAVVGATIFEVGSILLMLEAVNENRSDCFGWAVEESLEGILNLEHEESGCRHSHAHKKAFLKPAPPRPDNSVENGTKPDDEPAKSRAWSWWPSWYELHTHYFHDIGFLACSSQMFGATIFWISGFTALPPILSNLSVPATNGVYWLPQVVGGTGFIVSSFLFMLETQPKWYIPAPHVLGWHIGLWNLLGAIGFTLCGALGFGGMAASIQYALTLSSFIGSWSFLVSFVMILNFLDT